MPRLRYCPSRQNVVIIPGVTHPKSPFHWGLALVLTAALLVIIFLRPVKAQAGSAAELIAAVNAYRADNDLAPYSVDDSLMSKAQAQSEYQASIDDCTHQRADGSSPGDHGIAAENVACGIQLSVDGAIFGQWTDALHSATILGPDTGVVGAGVATMGDMVYYTLDVNRLTGNFNYREPKQAEQPTALPGADTSTPNPQPVASGPLLTSTPAEDGSIQHRLRFGETLVQVAQAYGITLQSLYAANPGLDPTQPVYYEGQVLLIRPANTVTPTPTQTLTPRPPTRTSPPTRTPTRVVTATPSITPSATPLIDLSAFNDLGYNRRTLGIGVILVCALGAAVVLLRGFRRPK